MIRSCCIVCIVWMIHDTNCDDDDPSVDESVFGQDGEMNELRF